MISGSAVQAFTLQRSSMLINDMQRPSVKACQQNSTYWGPQHVNQILTRQSNSGVSLFATIANSEKGTQCRPESYICRREIHSDGNLTCKIGRLNANLHMGGCIEWAAASRSGAQKSRNPSLDAIITVQAPNVR